jgi:hypothetical protein
LAGRFNIAGKLIFDNSISLHSPVAMLGAAGEIVDPMGERIDTPPIGRAKWTGWKNSRTSCFTAPNRLSWKPRCLVSVLFELQKAQYFSKDKPILTSQIRHQLFISGLYTSHIHREKRIPENAVVNFEQLLPPKT